MTNTNQPTTQVDFEVSVYVMTTWATGAPKSTTRRTFTIREDATILGGCRAIDQAVSMCKGHDLCEVSAPFITPNPAELGWPIGA